MDATYFLSLSGFWFTWFNLVFVLLVWKISWIFCNILSYFIVWWSLAEQFVSRCNLPIVTSNSDSNCYVINTPHSTHCTATELNNPMTKWQKSLLWLSGSVGPAPHCQRLVSTTSTPCHTNSLISGFIQPLLQLPYQ